MKNFLKFLFFLSIGLVVLFLVYRSNQAAYLAECLQKGTAESECSLFQQVINDFKSVKYQWLVLVISLFMLSNFSRARRWILMMRSMGYQPKFANAFWTVMLGYFANLGIPRSGEFVRAATFGKYENIAFEKVMGTVVQDRILDVLCLLVCIGLTFIFEYDVFYYYLNENFALAEKINDNKGLLLGLSGFGVLTLAGLFYFRKNILDSALGKKLVKILSGFKEGLFSLRNVPNPSEFVFHTIFIWAMYYLMNYVCFFSFEPTSYLGPDAGLVSFVFGAIGIVFPSPGGMGSYHFLVQESLNLYGVPPTPNGFSFAMIAYVTIQIICNVSFGLMSLISLPIINKKKNDA